MKAQETGGGSKMGLAWAAATVETLAVSRDDGGVSVDVAWVLL